MNLGHATEKAADGETRILIVDDDEQMVCLLGGIVTDDGYAWSAARSGAEARACLSEDSFALMLVDVNHFDPELLDLFMQSMDDVLKIQSKYADATPRTISGTVA